MTSSLLSKFVFELRNMRCANLRTFHPPLSRNTVNAESKAPKYYGKVKIDSLIEILVLFRLPAGFKVCTGNLIIIF